MNSMFFKKSQIQKGFSNNLETFLFSECKMRATSRLDLSLFKKRITNQKKTKKSGHLKKNKWKENLTSDRRAKIQKQSTKHLNVSLKNRMGTDRVTEETEARAQTRRTESRRDTEQDKQRVRRLQSRRRAAGGWCSLCRNCCSSIRDKERMREREEMSESAWTRPLSCQMSW